MLRREPPAAPYRFASWGVLPLGALTGGQLAGACGDRLALAIIGVCGFTSLAALWWSPLRRYRVLGQAATDANAPVPMRHRFGLDQALQRSMIGRQTLADRVAVAAPVVGDAVRADAHRGRR